MTLHCLQIKVGTSQFGIQSLVWYSVWSCVTSSSYPHSQCSPLGTLCPCYLEHPTVLTILWINLFLLIPWSPFLYWANSYVTFKVLMKCHLLQEAFSDSLSIAPAASFSGFVWHSPHTSIYAILSVIYVSQLLQAGDLGVPSLCLIITQFCVWYVVGFQGMWIEQIFPQNSDLSFKKIFLTNHLYGN